jgi:hypothetical protein
MIRIIRDAVFDVEEENIPRGLKPIHFLGSIGTTKVVP